jgi:hypothetical protein
MKLKFALFGIISLLFSCKTYTITPESFKSQFTKIDNNEMKEVKTNNPLYFKNFKYLSNNIMYLNVIDKKGNLVLIENSPSLEMRVTLVNGKRKYFYFDTIILENDILKGGKSRFM